ncbi:L-dopachrome tautomerase-related protein [Microbulbifer harenosus]|uniref:Major royal jelly protein n=1 Tax=Microbulbifer harenosus TaxID=2576840 RepID=A0ABY2UES4_9GAMM|nr:L-dopachrome tautomerase-related protein [Microbulbifer harenosus]TLM75652.1 hypothetical protein FDY93_15250 [Microbulbifer harenosus]
MKYKFLAAALAASLLLPAAAVSAQPGGKPQLEVAAESDEMIWNAVAVHRDRVFVAGPRWTGSKGPALALLDNDGKPKAYPDAAWNAWHPGADAAGAFVNINAIHLDRDSLWVVDTGAPDFGGDPLPGGAKLVHIDLVRNQVVKRYFFGPEIAPPGSYVDDVRFRGDIAYLTDAGRPGLIVLDLENGMARRVLEGHPSTVASTARPIVLDGNIVKAPDGSPLMVNSDPLDLSPDGKWLYFGPLSGPWSRIETRWLDDAGLSAEELAAKVEPWTNLPPVGGTVVDANGDFYFTDLAENALKRRAPDGEITTVIRDQRLHWVDAPFIEEERTIWLPVPQMDRVALFNGGTAKTRWPVQLFRLELEKK